MTFLDAVRDVGMETVLIQRRENIEVASQTSFLLALISNTATWWLAILLTPSIAEFFHEPLIRMVLPILSFSLVL